jgi:hypothetical protein
MENEYKRVFYRLNALNDTLISAAQNHGSSISDGSWDSFNASLATLNSMTGDEHYLTLKIVPRDGASRLIVPVSNFSMKAYQAVKYLYDTQSETLCYDDPPQKPNVKSGEGNTFSHTAVMNQDQRNSQSQRMEVNIEFNQTLTYMTEAIVESRLKYPEGTKERTFLDRLKDGISAAKSTADLIKMIMMTAAQYGISTDVLKDIFS